MMMHGGLICDVLMAIMFDGLWQHNYSLMI